MTIILTENGGANTYFIYFSSALHQYVDVSTTMVSSDYDIAVANGANLGTLVSNQEMNIGNRFKVLYTEIQSNSKAWLKVTIDGQAEFTVYMQAQPYSQRNNRYAMHYVQMSVPSELKCLTCMYLLFIYVNR